MRSFFLLIVCCNLAACVFNANRVSGNGEAATEVRKLQSFAAVELESSFEVELRKGTVHEVEVRADKNLLPYIETEVSGNSLVISTKDNHWFSPKTRIRIVVTAPDLESLTVSGSGTINSGVTLQSSNKVSVDVSGSGTVNAPIDAPETELSLSGSGDVNLRGQTRDLDVSIAGSGDVRCFDLASEAATVSISGSGDAEVYASKRLDISLVGSGDVAYKGKPAITKNKTGSGSVTSAD